MKKVVAEKIKKLEDERKVLETNIHAYDSSEATKSEFLQCVDDLERFFKITIEINNLKSEEDSWNENT